MLGYGALLVGGSLVSACGDEAVDTACCRLLVYCDHCGCNDAELTIGASEQDKACKVTLDRQQTCQVDGLSYSKDTGADACK